MDLGDPLINFESSGVPLDDKSIAADYVIHKLNRALLDPEIEGKIGKKCKVISLVGGNDIPDLEMIL